jgi:predicted nucleic acid-binding protein
MIDFLNDRDRARNLLAPMLADRLAISIISVGEVYEGILRGRNAAEAEVRFLELIDQMDVVGLDVPTMKVFASIRGDLRRAGQTVSDNDLYIAATAIRRDMTLVTRNRKHFDRIPGLRLYQADDGQ